MAESHALTSSASSTFPADTVTASPSSFAHTLGQNSNTLRIMKAATTAPVLIVIRNQNAKRELTGKFGSVLERLLSQGASSGSSSSLRCAGVVIKGEKQEQKEERGLLLNERRFGSFERSFRMPEGVETDKIEASFKDGVLAVQLPKSAEAQEAEKKIAVKAS